jgi:hypothetical protein
MSEATRGAERGARILRDLDGTCTCTSENDYMCPYHDLADMIDVTLARAVEGERERCNRIFDDYFAPDDDAPMVARCRAALRAPKEPNNG